MRKYKVIFDTAGMTQQIKTKMQHAVKRLEKTQQTLEYAIDCYKSSFVHNSLMKENIRVIKQEKEIISKKIKQYRTQLNDLLRMNKYVYQK